MREHKVYICVRKAGECGFHVLDVRTARLGGFEYRLLCRCGERGDRWFSGDEASSHHERFSRARFDEHLKAPSIPRTP